MKKKRDPSPSAQDDKKTDDKKTDDKKTDDKIIKLRMKRFIENYTPLRVAME